MYKVLVLTFDTLALYTPAARGVSVHHHGGPIWFVHQARVTGEMLSRDAQDKQHPMRGRVERRGT